MEEKNLALDLRIRLVREVAAPDFQMKLLDQQVQVISGEMAAISGESHKIFLQSFGEECISNAQQGMLVISAMELEEKYQQHVDSGAEHFKELNEKRIELEKQSSQLHRETRAALNSIVEDVLKEKYGRGELTVTREGVVRIIGRIDDLEELRSLCLGNDDYELLNRYLLAGNILWEFGMIYCAERNSVCEIYLLPFDEKNIVIVRVNKMLTFPYCEAIVLGKVCRSEHVLQELTHWGGCSNIPVEVENAFSEQGLALLMVEKHITSRQQGLITKMPQLEMQ